MIPRSERGLVLRERHCPVALDEQIVALREEAVAAIASADRDAFRPWLIGVRDTRHHRRHDPQRATPRARASS
jgi:hypothetical protein